MKLDQVLAISFTWPETSCAGNKQRYTGQWSDPLAVPLVLAHVGRTILGLSLLSNAAKMHQRVLGSAVAPYMRSLSGVAELRRMMKELQTRS
jgi:hypothetical protein